MAMLKYKDPGDGQWKPVPVGGYGIPKFATVAARNAAFPTPTAGDTCWVTSARQQQTWDATAAFWIPTGGRMPNLAVDHQAGFIVSAGVTLMTGGTVQWTASGSPTYNPTTGLATIVTPGIYELSIYVSGSIAGDAFMGGRVARPPGWGTGILSNINWPAFDGGARATGAGLDWLNVGEQVGGLVEATAAADVAYIYFSLMYAGTI